MKSVLLIFAFAFSTLCSQAQSIEGTYTNTFKGTTGEPLTYTLTLNADGTFIFESLHKLLPPSAEKSITANGTWKAEGHLLILMTTPTESTKEDFGMDLNNSKARYTSISPRNPNFNELRPSLKFFKSDAFYGKNTELYKKEATVTLK